MIDGVCDCVVYDMRMSQFYTWLFISKAEAVAHKIVLIGWMVGWVTFLST